MGFNFSYLEAQVVTPNTSVQGPASNTTTTTQTTTVTPPIISPNQPTQGTTVTDPSEENKNVISVLPCSSERDLYEYCLDGGVLSKVTKVKRGRRAWLGIFGEKKDKVKYKPLTAAERAEFDAENGITYVTKTGGSTSGKAKYKRCTDCSSKKGKKDDDDDDSDDDTTTTTSTRRRARDPYQDAQDRYVRVYGFCRGGDAENWAKDAEDEEDKKEDDTAKTALKDAEKALKDAKALSATALAAADAALPKRNEACHDACIDFALGQNGFNYSTCKITPTDLCSYLQSGDSAKIGTVTCTDLAKQTNVNTSAVCDLVFSKSGCIDDVKAEKVRTLPSTCNAEFAAWKAKVAAWSVADQAVASAQVDLDTATKTLKETNDAKLANKVCSIDYLTSLKAQEKDGYLRCTSKSIINAASRCERALADAQSDINNNLKYCATCGNGTGTCAYGACRGVSTTAQILGAVLPSVAQLGLGFMNMSMQNKSLQACMSNNAALIEQGRVVGTPPQTNPCGVQSFMPGYNNGLGYGAYGFNQGGIPGILNGGLQFGMNGFNNGYNPLYGGFNNGMNGAYGNGMNNMYNLYATQQQQFSQLGAQNQVLAQTQMSGINPLGNSQFNNGFGNNFGYNNYNNGFNNYNQFNVSPYAYNAGQNTIGLTLPSVNLNAGANLNLGGNGYNNYGYNGYNNNMYNGYNNFNNYNAYNNGFNNYNNGYNNGFNNYNNGYNNTQQQYVPNNGCSYVIVQVGGSC